MTQGPSTSARASLSAVVSVVAEKVGGYTMGEQLEEATGAGAALPLPTASPAKRLALDSCTRRSVSTRALSARRNGRARSHSMLRV